MALWSKEKHASRVSGTPTLATMNIREDSVRPRVLGSHKQQEEMQSIYGAFQRT